MSKLVTAERNNSIYQERQSGATFKALGIKYGVTTERARQIYLKQARRAEQARTKKLYGTRQLIDSLEREKRIIIAVRSWANKELTESDVDLITKLDSLISVYSD